MVTTTVPLLAALRFAIGATLRVTFAPLKLLSATFGSDVITSPHLHASFASLTTQPKAGMQMGGPGGRAFRPGPPRKLDSEIGF